LFVILKQVVRSRHKGIYQADVSKNYGIDGRSAGHICKSLEERGCIIRKRVSLKGAHTNLCIHVRFASLDKTVDMSKATEDRAFYNVNANNEAFTQKQLRDAMIELIKDAPGHAILAKDALEALVRKKKDYTLFLFNTLKRDLIMIQNL
jgi:predicted transcriptional regulator